MGLAGEFYTFLSRWAQSHLSILHQCDCCSGRLSAIGYCAHSLTKKRKKTLHLGRDVASSLLSRLGWFSDFLLPLAYPRSRLFSPVWIKSSIYQSQTKTQSLADSLALDQLSLRERWLIEPGHMWAPPRSPFLDLQTGKCPTPHCNPSHTHLNLDCLRNQISFPVVNERTNELSNRRVMKRLSFFKMLTVQYHLQM